MRRRTAVMPAPVSGGETASALGNSQLRADEEFITDEVRAEAKDLKSDRGWR